MMLLFLLCCVGVLNADSPDSLEDIPFETAKVIYHKQRICIFRPGNPTCYGSEKIPGDPKEVADLYKVQKNFQNDIKKLKPERLKYKREHLKKLKR